MLPEIKSAEPNELSDEEKAAYALAFDSIHKTPLRAFDRKQRTTIFNRVSEGLFQNMASAPQLLKDHLKLLIAYLVHPNKSMNLIRIPSGLPNESDKAGDTGKVALFRIAEILSARFTSPYVDGEASFLMKLLARKVLE
ncbi:MAG: hypothetical protein Q9225_006549 [Loekoesia sp. 1 TL-2023]